MKKSLILLAFVFLIVGFSSREMLAASKRENHLIASMAFIPGLLETSEYGPFVDFLKALERYTYGTIKMDVFPYARSIYNVVEGNADFQVPNIRDPSFVFSDTAYRHTKEDFGTVSFVIYSNIKKPITKSMILDALKTKGAFPYIFEGALTESDILGFPCLRSNDYTLSIQKVQKGKIDALIWAQEETDKFLRSQNIKDIHREHWKDFESVFVVANNSHGEEIDRILSNAIKEMRASGQLKLLYAKIHKPYQNWQPSDASVVQRGKTP